MIEPSYIGNGSVTTSVNKCVGGSPVHIQRTIEKHRARQSLWIDIIDYFDNISIILCYVKGNLNIL